MDLGYTCMGIKLLYKIIEDKAPDAITYKDIEDYRGKIVAVDANQAIHRIIRNLVKDGELVKNAVIHAVWFKHVSYLKFGIKAIWVFDGKPPAEKEGVLKKRRDSKEKARETLENKKDLSDEERDRIAKRTVGISIDDIKDIKRLLDLANVPFIIAKAEADP
jgi:flap endonuclease-1